MQRQNYYSVRDDFVKALRYLEKYPEMELFAEGSVQILQSMLLIVQNLCYADVADRKMFEDDQDGEGESGYISGDGELDEVQVSEDEEASDEEGERSQQDTDNDSSSGEESEDDPDYDSDADD